MISTDLSQYIEHVPGKPAFRCRLCNYEWDSALIVMAKSRQEIMDIVSPHFDVNHPMAEEPNTF